MVLQIPDEFTECKYCLELYYLQSFYLVHPTAVRIIQRLCIQLTVDTDIMACTNLFLCYVRLIFFSAFCNLFFLNAFLCVHIWLTKLEACLLLSTRIALSQCIMCYSHNCFNGQFLSLTFPVELVWLSCDVLCFCVFIISSPHAVMC